MATGDFPNACTCQDKMRTLSGGVPLCPMHDAPIRWSSVWEDGIKSPLGKLTTTEGFSCGHNWDDGFFDPFSSIRKPVPTPQEIADHELSLCERCGLWLSCIGAKWDKEERDE